MLDRTRTQPKRAHRRAARRRGDLGHSSGELRRAAPPRLFGLGALRGRNGRLSSRRDPGGFRPLRVRDRDAARDGRVRRPEGGRRVLRAGGAHDRRRVRIRGVRRRPRSRPRDGRMRLRPVAARFELSRRLARRGRRVTALLRSGRRGLPAWNHASGGPSRRRALRARGALSCRLALRRGLVQSHRLLPGWPRRRFCRRARHRKTDDGRLGGLDGSRPRAQRRKRVARALPPARDAAGPLRRRGARSFRAARRRGRRLGARPGRHASVCVGRRAGPSAALDTGRASRGRFGREFDRAFSKPRRRCDRGVLERAGPVRGGIELFCPLIRPRAICKRSRERRSEGFFAGGACSQSPASGLGPTSKEARRSEARRARAAARESDSNSNINDATVCPLLDAGSFPTRGRRRPKVSAVVGPVRGVWVSPIP